MNEVGSDTESSRDGCALHAQGSGRRWQARRSPAFAADITEHWNETHGTTITWGLEVGGDVGTAYWITDDESLAAMETVMRASMVNEETRKRTREGVGLFATLPQDKIIYTM